MRLTVHMEWEQNLESDLAGYQVIWTDGKKEQVVLVRANVLSADLSVRLKPKTVYTFAVAAFDLAGNVSERWGHKSVYVEG